MGTGPILLANARKRRWSLVAVVITFASVMIIRSWLAVAEDGIESKLVEAKSHEVNLIYPSSFPDDVCDASKKDFRSASGLYGILTGCEHSGTTITSQIIMSAPNLFGAVEGGMLMVNEPRDFSKALPFYNWTLSPGNWNLTEVQRDSLVKSECFADLYIKLRQYSPIYQWPVNSNSWVFDKTPGYIRRLVEVMDLTPGVPVVVTQKPFADQVKSLQKRDHVAPEDHIHEGEKSLRKALAKYPDRIHVINMTEFYQNPNGIMDETFRFLGLTWKPEYLNMSAINAKVPPEVGRVVPPFDPQGMNRTQTGLFEFHRLTLPLIPKSGGLDENAA